MCIAHQVPTVTHATLSICMTDNVSQTQMDAMKVLNRITSSISRTKFQSLKVSCILSQLSSLNPLKPGVKLRMKM